MTIESNLAFRLTPEQLAAAERAREYWASRHEHAARARRPPLERDEQRKHDAEPPHDESR